MFNIPNFNLSKICSEITQGVIEIAAFSQRDKTPIDVKEASLIYGTLAILAYIQRRLFYYETNPLVFGGVFIALVFLTLGLTNYVSFCSRNCRKIRRIMLFCVKYLLVAILISNVKLPIGNQDIRLIEYFVNLLVIPVQYLPGLDLSLYKYRTALEALLIGIICIIIALFISRSNRFTLENSEEEKKLRILQFVVAPVFYYFIVAQKKILLFW